MSGDGAPRKEHLDRQVAGGVVWTATAKWATQLLTWGSVLVAARMLSPADFGLMEMAGIVTLVAMVLADFGIGAAVVQMRELEKSRIAQVNTVSILLGVIAVLLGAAVAPLLAWFYRAPALTLLVSVNSLGFLITSLQVVPNALLQRDLDYRRLSLAEAAHAAVQASATVICAVAGMGYWTFVVAAFSGRGIATLLAWYWRPAGFALPRWREIGAPLRFGSQVAVTNIMSTLFVMMDTIVVGRVLGESRLGQYRIAINLGGAPAEKVGQLIMRVTGPLFARVQADVVLMRRYFFYVTEVLALVMFPLSIGLALTAEEVIRVILGARWEEAIEPMRWLALYTAVRSLQTIANQALISLRETRFLMALSISNLVVMTAAFVVAAPHGLGMVAAAWLVAAPLTALPSLLRVFHRMEFSPGHYLRALGSAAAATLAMAVAVFGVRDYIPWAGTSWWKLAAEVGVGAAVYAAVLFGVFRSRVALYFQFFRDMRSGAPAPSGVV
jgi:PST family polysaccharide transporter